MGVQIATILARKGFKVYMRDIKPVGTFVRMEFPLNQIHYPLAGIH